MAQDDNKEINISYETLFELLRREKNRDALQELSPTFYADSVDYIKSKKQILKNKREDIDNFSDEEIRKIEVQISNINKILKELYDKREKKLVSMAMSRCRTGTDMAEISNLAPPERLFYNDVVAVFSKYRLGILAGIVEPSNSRLNSAESEFVKSESNGLAPQINALHEKYLTLGNGIEESANSVSVEYSEEAGEADESEISRVKPAQKSSSSYDEESVVVRFIQPVPKFLGRDLSEFGPYAEDEIATLPSEIAKILVTKNRVEEIRSE